MIRSSIFFNTCSSSGYRLKATRNIRRKRHIRCAMQIHVLCFQVCSKVGMIFAIKSFAFITSSSFFILFHFLFLLISYSWCMPIELDFIAVFLFFFHLLFSHMTFVFCSPHSSKRSNYLLFQQSVTS